MMMWNVCLRLGCLHVCVVCLVLVLGIGEE